MAGVSENKEGLMKGLNISMQIECQCGELVQAEHSSTGMGNQAPMLQQFVAICKCGIKFFTHVQESKSS